MKLTFTQSLMLLDSACNFTFLQFPHRNLENSNINTTNLPTEIGLLSNLEKFYVWSVTADGGTIPTEFGRLTLLEELEIRGADYSGEIPTELGQLTMLDSLALSGGNLVGTTNITSNYFFYNLFCLHLILLVFLSTDLGSIPSELGLLTQLTKLSLTQNSLEGTVPIEIGNLSQLRFLELHFNDLTGSVPNGICVSTSIEVDRDCAITECDCCYPPCRIRDKNL